MHGYTLAELEFRKQFGINVLTVNRPFQTENTQDVAYIFHGLAETATKLQKDDKMVDSGGINECAELIELD